MSWLYSNVFISATFSRTHQTSASDAVIHTIVWDGMMNELWIPSNFPPLQIKPKIVLASENSEPCPLPLGQPCSLVIDMVTACIFEYFACCVIQIWSHLFCCTSMCYFILGRMFPTCYLWRLTITNYHSLLSNGSATLFIWLKIRRHPLPGRDIWTEETTPLKAL